MGSSRSQHLCESFLLQTSEASCEKYQAFIHVRDGLNASSRGANLLNGQTVGENVVFFTKFVVK